MKYKMVSASCFIKQFTLDDDETHWHTNVPTYRHLAMKFVLKRPDDNKFDMAQLAGMFVQWQMRFWFWLSLMIGPWLNISLVQATSQAVHDYKTWGICVSNGDKTFELEHLNASH